MDIKRKLNYGAAFDISGSFYVGSPAYKVPIDGLLCVSITTSSQPAPQVNLRIANSGTASASSNVFAIWGHNGGGAEYNIAPVTIPVFSGNSCYLEKVGGGGGSRIMACIIPYYDN